MSRYNSKWPSQFDVIAGQLSGDLNDHGVDYLSIEHIGSTSVPGLNAKPIIDILILVDSANMNDTYLEKIRHALCNGDRQGGYYYIGNGGVLERWSFKLNVRDDEEGNPLMPRRHVYVVAQGGIQARNCLALRDTLRVDAELREEYGRLKWELAQYQYTDIWEYSTLKDQVVREILRKAGWSETEIDKKEAQRVINWPSEFII